MSVLVVAALERELGGAFTGLPLLHTGIGKVNAAYALMRHLLSCEISGEDRPSLVVNLGTAGSPDVLRGTILSCTRFVQGDMNCSPLGSQPGITPFDPVPYKKDHPWIEVENRFPGTHFDGRLWRTYCKPDGTPGVVTCITRDQFVVREKEQKPDFIRTEVFEMEAWALARVCLREGIPFASLKYVSDGAGDVAAKEWKDSLPAAAIGLRAAFDTLIEFKKGE